VENPTITPEWRTPTVVELCQSMREARDYSALPILADALQDAGCGDDELLKQLRGGSLERWQAERLVALIYSAESAAAVRWLEQFVRDINYDEYDDYKYNEETGEETYTNRRQSDADPHSYSYVIDQGREGAGGRGMFFGSDAGADYFRESEENVREFFRNWSLATGEAMPDDLGDLSVRCAC
jgi:hypothetical protein